jgi:site-specific recombinase XerD
VCPRSPVGPLRLCPSFFPLAAYEECCSAISDGLPSEDGITRFCFSWPDSVCVLSEVVALNLEDIDWDNAQLIVRGKGAHRVQLPLPADVGEAIAQYLRHGRPCCSCRRVFIRDKAPRTGFANRRAICTLVMRALERAGVDSARKGAHLLRHSLATAMIRRGASLDEIGNLLGHQSPDTTMIYAKVDLPALMTLALPWPGGAR